MTDDQCPNKQALKQYVHGSLDAESVEQLEEHVDSCEACEDTLLGLDGTTDLFLAALRKKVPNEQAQFLEEAALKAVAQKAAKLVPFGDAVTVDSSAGNKDVDVSEPSSSLLASERIGQYELMSELGRGGMGVVYKARHAKLDRVVALKVLPAEKLRDPQALERFEREMKAVGRLHHPGIVQAFDADEVNGLHYLAMEFVDGPNLSELLKRIGPLSVSDACEIARQAAVGLQHAHENGLVHRDLKPGNLMLAASGDVKILDLGLALLQSSPLQGGELTSTGQLMGTIDYMPPEQAEDTHNVDIRADVYSLGATLYALLSGHPPYGGTKHPTLLKKIAALASEDVSPISDHRNDIPPDLATFLHRMLSRDVDHRPSPPSEVVVALTPFAAGSDLQAVCTGYSTGSGDSGRRNSTDAVDPVTGSLRDTQLSGSASSALEETIDSVSDLTPQVARTPLRPAVKAASKATPIAEAQNTGDRGRRSKLLIAAGLFGLVLWAVIIQLKTSSGTIVLEMDKVNSPEPSSRLTKTKC